MYKKKSIILWEKLQRKAIERKLGEKFYGFIF